MKVKSNLYEIVKPNMKKNNYVIKESESKNYAEISQVVKLAFETAKYSDGNEHVLVNELKDSNSCVHELSLIACEDQVIVGHIMFTVGRVDSEDVLILAPLSVLPSHQGKGIGRSLINEAHKIAATLGYNYSIVLGEREYYEKSGYVVAERYGISAPFKIAKDYFLACKLRRDAPIISGIVNYPIEFGIN